MASIKTPCAACRCRVRVSRDLCALRSRPPLACAATINRLLFRPCSPRDEAAERAERGLLSRSGSLWLGLREHKSRSRRGRSVVPITTPCASLSRSLCGCVSRRSRFARFAGTVAVAGAVFLALRSGCCLDRPLWGGENCPDFDFYSPRRPKSKRAYLHERVRGCDRTRSRANYLFLAVLPYQYRPTQSR